MSARKMYGGTRAQIQAQVEAQVQSLASPEPILVRTAGLEPAREVTPSGF